MTAKFLKRLTPGAVADGSIQITREHRIATGVLAVVFCISIAAHADIGGRIAGVVTDPTGAIVAGATVTLTNTSSGTKHGD